MPKTLSQTDIDLLAELIAARYRPTTVENVVPARVETVSETVLTNERFVKNVRRQPSTFQEALAMDFRKDIAIVKYALRLALAASLGTPRCVFDKQLGERIGATFRSARRTERRRLARELRSIFNSVVDRRKAKRTAGGEKEAEPDFQEALAWSFRKGVASVKYALRLALAASLGTPRCVFDKQLGERVGGGFRSARRTERRRLARALRPILTTTALEYREVERTVEVEKEIEPERTVYTTEPSTRRLLSFGRGGVNFRASRTVGGGALVAGPPALSKTKRVRLPALEESPEEVMNAVSLMESNCRFMPWVLDGEARLFPVADSARDSAAAASTDSFEEPLSLAGYYSDGLPMRGIERALVEHAEYMRQAFADRRDDIFDIDVLTDSRLIRALVPVSDAENGADASGDAFSDLAESSIRKTSELQAVAERWPASYREVADFLLSARDSSLGDQVPDECLDFTTAMNESAYNMYCPDCNGGILALLENRVYDVQSGEANEPLSFSANTRCVCDYDENGATVWRCLSCESETYIPILVHKMLDELLLPAYDHLLNENQVERLRAHRQARGKEIEYKASYRTEIEKAQLDHFRRMDGFSEEMERVTVDIQGENLALDSLREVLAAYQLKQHESLSDIRRNADAVDQEIRLRTQRVLNVVDSFKNREMAALSDELRTLSIAQREEDARRDAVQKGILEYAKKTSEGQRELIEQSARQHRESEDRSDRRHGETIRESRRSEAKASKLTKAVSDRSYRGHKAIYDRLR